MDELGLRDRVLRIARETKPQYEQYEMPGVGTVHVKRLTGGEKDLFERACKDYVGRAITLVHCCFDEQGAKVFRDEDVAALAQLDPLLTDHIVKAALRLNRYTEPEQDELLKNSNGQAVNL